MSRIFLGVDIGGTFTDVVATDIDRHTSSKAKVLTTGSVPTAAVLEGVDLVLKQLDLDFPDVERIVHGTTLATNAVIERKGARTALLTTEGFRDILEAGTEFRYDMYDLTIQNAEPLVPRRHRIGIPERILADGTVYRPLDKDAVERVAKSLVEAGIDSVAVCFLHSYQNPVHERETAELLRQHMPDAEVTTSFETAPVIGEFPRMSTTVISAYVKPLMRSYLTDLEEQLRGRGYTGPIYMVASNGGAVEVKYAKDDPVQLIESGPAAGISAVARYSAATRKSMLAFDMGGTTAKMAFVRNGVPEEASELEVARAARFKKGSGLVVRIPVLELLEIGAGGGSIAHVDELGLLRVGPESAGSDPGPSAYGLGGTQPTVTDANLTLGLIDPEGFAGGSMELDRDASRRALMERVAGPLGLADPVTAAAAVYRTVSNDMALATQVFAAEKGLDVREYSLVASGGGGPVHAAAVARALGIGTVLVPPSAGVMTATGCSVAPLRMDSIRSYKSRVDQLDVAAILTLIREMKESAQERIQEAGDAPGRIVHQLVADMRYLGQRYELPVEIRQSDLAEGGERLRHRYERAYAAKYGRTLTIPVEVLNWRVRSFVDDTTSGPTWPRPHAALPQAPGRATRHVHFPDLDEAVECPYFERETLEEGWAGIGPLLIGSADTTIVVPPSARVSCLSDQTIRIDLEDPS